MKCVICLLTFIFSPSWLAGAQKLDTSIIPASTLLFFGMVSDKGTEFVIVLLLFRFMVRLQEQLEYFVSNKISNDPLWQKVKVILSGHETPGEGEHKIMDYIRFEKAQPGN